MQTEVRVATTVRDANISPFAWRWVLAIAGGAALLLMLVSGRYGYFGDELYFMAAGQHLSWGYADQPPLMPFLCHTMDLLFPGSLVALRMPATIATAVGTVAAALITRELGGRHKAQLLTAAAYVLVFISYGHQLVTYPIDYCSWTIISWLIVRWVRLRQDWLLLLSGLVTAISLQTKFLIPVFWFALVISVLVLGPRELLRRPMLWAGGALTALFTVPTLLWQAANGWPQIQMTRVIAGETTSSGGHLTFLKSIMTMDSPYLSVGALLTCYGLWWLLRSPALRPYRFLGLTAITVTVIFLVARGRPTYAFGVFPICWAAGMVELQRRTPINWLRWWRWLLSWPALALSIVVIVIATLPVVPLPPPGNPLATTVFGELCWPEMTGSIATAYQSLPADVRQGTAVMTDLYWTSSAVDHFGPALGLPKTYSGNRGYWYFGSPPESDTNVIYSGADNPTLRQNFTSVQQLPAVIDNTTGYCRATPIWLYFGRKLPWSKLWPQLQQLA